MFDAEKERPTGEPKRDLHEVFDLDRKKLTKTTVDQMEQAMRDIDAAREDQFSKRDIEAMKKIAKLRKDDKKGAAREQLEALERIGGIVGFDLFDWASERA